MRKGVLLHLHFNLSLALLLVFLVFVAGVKFATFNHVSASEVP